MPPTACAHSSQRISTNVASGFSLAITAGFCEEFLYRGWLLNLTGAFLHSVRIGLLISSTFFGFAHIAAPFSAPASSALSSASFASPPARCSPRNFSTPSSTSPTSWPSPASPRAPIPPLRLCHLQPRTLRCVSSALVIWPPLRLSFQLTLPATQSAFRITILHKNS